MILLTYKKQTKHFHSTYEAVQLISSHKMHVFGQIAHPILMYQKNTDMNVKRIYCALIYATYSIRGDVVISI